MAIPVPLSDRNKYFVVQWARVHVEMVTQVRGGRGGGGGDVRVVQYGNVENNNNNT